MIAYGNGIEGEDGRRRAELTMADGPLNERQRDSTVNILGILVVLCVPNGASIGVAQLQCFILARGSEPPFAEVRATTGQGDL